MTPTAINRLAVAATVIRHQASTIRKALEVGASEAARDDALFALGALEGVAENLEDAVRADARDLLAGPPPTLRIDQLGR